MDQYGPNGLVKSVGKVLGVEGLFTLGTKRSIEVILLLKEDPEPLVVNGQPVTRKELIYSGPTSLPVIV